MLTIPKASEVAQRLRPFSNAQLEKLAAMSGVPFHTLLKIRAGETGNPRIDTVGQFWPFIDKVLAQ